MFCCLRRCLHNNRLRSTTQNQHAKPEIHLDSGKMCDEVILLSNQLRATGTGGVLATAPIVQSKAYFEVKIQQSGCWSIGLATQQADLARKYGGTDKESWCLCSDNSTRHNNQEFRPVTINEVIKDNNNTLINNDAAAAATTATTTTGLVGIEDVPDDDVLAGELNNIDCSESSGHIFPDEGDIVGVAYDHIELNFYFNGKNLDIPFRNVRGNVYPIIFVGNGAILDIILDNFHFSPPPGFDRIMLEQSLL